MPERTDSIDREAAAALYRGLGDPTRVAILVELAKHQRQSSDPLEFSDLRRRTGIEDSGRFNYHLNELVPRFVAKADAGYRLRYAGRQAYALIAAGTGTQESIEHSEAVDVSCLLCERSLTATYRHDLLRLSCSEHGEIVFIPIPPTVVADRSMEELLTVADATARSEREFVRSGVCGECWGSVTTTFRPVDPPSGSHPEAELIPVQYLCQECSHGIAVPFRYLLADHPAVVAFHQRHGVDIPNRFILDLNTHLAVANSRHVAGDPDVAEVAFELAGDVLVIGGTADGTITTVEYPDSVPSW